MGKILPESGSTPPITKVLIMLNVPLQEECILLVYECTYHVNVAVDGANLNYFIYFCVV